MSTRSNRGEGTASLEKAIDVLDAIGARAEGISQQALAERVALPRTTLYRILATLNARGLVRHDPARHVYCLGFRCLEMARQVYAQPDLVSAASHELRALRDLTGETSYVGALEGLDVVSLERFDSPHTLGSRTSHGHRKPVYATSQGKAILAALPKAERDAIVAAIRLKALTSLTITDRRRLLAELRVVASRGYAIDDEENVPGTRCVGAAIVDALGQVRGAISVAGPAYRLTHARLELLGPEIVAAARHIGASLAPLRSAAGGDDEAAVPTAAGAALYGAHPVWSAQRQALIWADTVAPALRVSSEAEGEAGEQRIPIPHPIRCLLVTPQATRVFHEGGSVVAEGKRRQPPPDSDRVLLAACTGANGEVWAASAQGGKCEIGVLDEDGSLTMRWLANHEVACLRWAPGAGLLFGIAADTGDILQFDPASRSVRTFARIPKSSGVLSGLDVDADGGVWVALRDGWSVMRFAADGNLDQTVPLPVPCPTGIAIGGADGRTVFVTTARQPVPLDVLKKAPLSGRVFSFRMR
ncbi:IclR family transcriptional regulator domain-containing protein [Burkholderia sp. Ac-20379]|uniref:IclR family transcriptional regulator domain-containing protein n=1 Tax=Burkholderia sp. Ac-20379 TaxID=2703900 RepID=UPI00198215FC|nr:IclR family transcriptional regulator C-terminal domain-containing protein [Burkholderia sp. Ac-20379]MBN3726704.1 helix-turn-helix domain-containing protein [Burkholderia sp. Ac-20379]